MKKSDNFSIFLKLVNPDTTTEEKNEIQDVIVREKAEKEGYTDNFSVFLKEMRKQGPS
jgi:hypothetical protein